MHNRARAPGGNQMRRQLARQQEQQDAGKLRPAPGRDLPAKQDQTRHNPVTETEQQGTFGSDQ